MVRCIRLNRLGILENSVAFRSIESGATVFFAFADHEFEKLLTISGFTAKLLPETLPEEATLIINDRPIYELVHVADRLLGPGGCPWDQAQTHESLKQYLLEECYELLDAIDSENDDKIREELGDVLLQPIMHAAMKNLVGTFDIDEVATEIVHKLIRRHPHVFGEVRAEDVDQVLKNWDRIKQSEKTGRQDSILGDIPTGAASLLRAYQISKRAARTGFEWPNVEAVFDKLDEERSELLEAAESGDVNRIEAEIGDLLFTVVNLARWLKVEPEEALRKMVNRFSGRFRDMESKASKPLGDLSPSEWDALWETAKIEETKTVKDGPKS